MKRIDQIVRSAKANVLGEVFLLSAIESYARQVLADDSDWGKSLVSKEAWQILAKHNLTMLENEGK